jgi:hypothetical protein
MVVKNSIVSQRGFYFVNDDWNQINFDLLPTKLNEYNVFLFDESPKGFKLLKIFKISLTFRFDKLSNLSKSVHIGENSQILTVSNKKSNFIVFNCHKFSFFLNCLLTALKQNEQITNRCPRQHIQRHISDRS